jgi:cell division protein FtsQ
MIFRAKKNRRRVDVAKKTAQLKAAASSFAPTLGRVLGAAVASAALVFAAHGGWEWAKQSPQFAIDELHFTGNKRASDAELCRVTGLQPGLNLVALDVLALERGLAAYPWVKQVKVERHFPRRLEIQITEHQPVAMVSLGDLYLLDDAGEPFKRVQPSDTLDLPLVTGIERDDYVARHDETVQRLSQALEVTRTWASSKSARNARLSEVHLDDEGLTLVVGDGEQIRLGEGDFPDKLARLERVRQELKSRSLSAEVIRLDNRARPSSITVSLRPLSTASPERGGRTGK